MRRGVLAFALALALAACGGRAAPTVSLRVTGGPPTARVTVDDAYVGTLDIVKARGVALPPGTHRISVEAPGYFPIDRIVVAPEGGAPIALDVRLEPIPD